MLWCRFSLVIARRAASTASPSPNRPATGAKKPVILSPDERKAARMANPAKRRKAIDRIDSDDEYPSRMQATATSQDSPVPPETPTRAAIERDLVLFMDNEAEEDNDIADDWNSPSPSPSQSLAGLPAKSVERSVERKGKASPQGKVVRIGHVYALPYMPCIYADFSIATTLFYWTCPMTRKTRRLLGLLSIPTTNLPFLRSLPSSTGSFRR